MKTIRPVFRRAASLWLPLAGLFGFSLCASGCSEDGETLVDADPSSGTGGAGGAQSGGETGGTQGMAPSGVGCTQEERIGDFSVDIADDSTTIQGQVSNGVSPHAIFEIADSAEGCDLFLPRNLFCSEPCASGTVCAGDDICVPQPEQQSVGDVTVSGLVQDQTLAPNGITFAYSKKYSDPFPLVEPGAAIVLQASGDVLGALTLLGEGIEPMTSPAATVQVERDTPTVVIWDPPANADGAAEVNIVINVDTHGGSGGRVECTAEDTGSFEVPAALVSGLMDLGTSGFPRAYITRQTVDSASIPEGCVDFFVASKLTLDIEIPGLTSCEDTVDCESGFVCSDVFVCEEEM